MSGKFVPRPNRYEIGITSLFFDICFERAVKYVVSVVKTNSSPLAVCQSALVGPPACLSRSPGPNRCYPARRELGSDPPVPRKRYRHRYLHMCMSLQLTAIAFKTLSSRTQTMHGAGRAGSQPCCVGAPHSCRTSHARSGKHVLVVLCLHRAADFGGTPDFEGLLVGAQAVTLWLDASVLGV